MSGIPQRPEAGNGRRKYVKMSVGTAISQKGAAYTAALTNFLYGRKVLIKAAEADDEEENLLIGAVASAG